MRVRNYDKHNDDNIDWNHSTTTNGTYDNEYDENDADAKMLMKNVFICKSDCFPQNNDRHAII